jgi:ABC-type Na+ efflux pump permease subunit
MMSTNPLPVRLLQYAVFLAVMYVAIQLSLAWGVEKKAWWQMSWELIAGGSIGAIAGLLFFAVFGSVGWVCGALYGALGLLSLMLGGALGGLGLGAIVHVLRDPQKYNYDWPVIVAVLVCGFVLARALSVLATRTALRSSQTAKLLAPPSGDA